MLSGLMLTAFLMGVGGMPHCAAMCGAACAVAFPRGLPPAGLLGRCLGYALMGAVAAASAGLIAQWGRQVAFLQPLWVLLQAAAVILGLFLMRSGRMPAQVDAWGQALYRQVRGRWSQLASTPEKSAMLHPLLPLLAGLAWVFLPCGLLYAALTVAALAASAWEGALVMLAFALPGAVGVWAAPAVLTWVSRRTVSFTPSAAPPAGSSVSSTAPILWLHHEKRIDASAPCPPAETARASLPAFDPRWAVRLSGAMLAVLGAWALYHQLLAQWRAWCA